MAVPTAFSQLSTTASSNDPADSEAVSQGDDHLRQIYAFIRSLYEGSSNGQMVFPATQNASTNANTLDDYEEGDWTPVDNGGGSLTYTEASGRYIKIGKKVHIWGRVVHPASADTNPVVIAGLPFTPSDNESVYGIAVSFSSILNGALVQGGSSNINFYIDGAAATNADVSTRTTVFGGAYEAAT